MSKKVSASTITTKKALVLEKTSDVDKSGPAKSSSAYPVAGPTVTPPY
jgi:hypothetical protein